MSAVGLRGVAAVVTLLLVTGCSSSDPAATKPVFGGGAASTTDPSQLTALKKAAGIKDCPTTGTPPGKGALPDVTLSCLGGGTPVRLSGLTGTPTVINLWASWCGPCRDELPLLAKADKAYGPKVRIVGVDFADAAPEAALELARRSGVTYPLLVDRKSALKSPLRVVGLPQTVFVDAQGRMVFSERAAFRSYADLTAAIRRHLGVSP